MELPTPTDEHIAARTLVPPIYNCGLIDPDDKCCTHPKAVTPECHQWCNRPRLKINEVPSLRFKGLEPNVVV